MVNRRQFLRGAGSLAIAAALASRPAEAAVSCVSVHSLKARCRAGLGQTPPIERQSCRALTWATCLTYMLRGYGAELDEQSVFARYGTDGACTPNGDDATRLMSAAGKWRDDFGRRFLVRTERLPDLAGGHMSAPDARTIISRLSRQPVLCGAAGHATLLTELGFDDGSVTRLKVTEAMVRDPWTGRRNLRPLTPDELTKPSYLIALSIRPL